MVNGLPKTIPPFLAIPKALRSCQTGRVLAEHAPNPVEVIQQSRGAYRMLRRAR